MQTSNVIQMPAALGVEASALAGILVSPEFATELLNALKPEHFWSKKYRDIFEACVIAESTGSIEAPVVAQILRDKKIEMPAVEIAKLLDEHVMTDVQSTIKILNDKLTLRHIIETSNACMKRALNNDNCAETLEFFQNSAFSLGESGKDCTMTPQQLIDLYGTSYEERFYDPREVTGLPTGLFDLDRMTAGLQPGDLVILAARPSMGKTALALNIARNASLRGKRGIFYSIEQPAKQLLDRLVTIETGIDIVKLRTGKFEEEKIDDINRAQARIEAWPLLFNDDGSSTPAQVIRHARKIKRRYGTLDYIIVDYLQLMKIEGTRNSNRNIDIGNVTRQFKLLAKELQIPIILLSQLSRELEKRTNKRPLLSDLRDSGNIEQDADVVLFIYRPGVYDEPEDFWGHAEILVSKQRQGPIGIAKAQFVSERMLFQNRSQPGTQENF